MFLACEKLARFLMNICAILRSFKQEKSFDKIIVWHYIEVKTGCDESPCKFERILIEYKWL